MRATFALLLPRALENAINQLAWDNNLRWQTGVGVRRIAPHISLKQPFEVTNDLGKVQKYLAKFAASVPPRTLTLTDTTVWNSVFALSVKETADLRVLHARLNNELPLLLGVADAEYDGADYRFHATITSGGANTPAFVHASFTVREIALFVYDEPKPNQWEHLAYDILPLTGDLPPVVF